MSDCPVNCPTRCTNVCGIKNRQLSQLPPEEWLEVKRPSGMALKTRLLLGKYEMQAPGADWTEEFSNLGDLKRRLREFP